MFRRPLLRTLAVLVISLALTAPLCEAASRGSSAPPARPIGIWEWVTSLWAKNGCSIDPGGICAPSPNSSGHSAVPVPSGSNLDEGCALDPGGRTCGGHS